MFGYVEEDVKLYRGFRGLGMLAAGASDPGQLLDLPIITSPRESDGDRETLEVGRRHSQGKRC